jgi:protoporphyrinogen/coproporphyrinogen III oxidase
MADQVQALVVGAGISGLATGYGLQKAGVSPFILESSPRPGGVIRSIQRDGFLIECGPQSFSGNAALTALCRDLQIVDQRVLADPNAPRYVLLTGKLEKVPMGPSLLASPLLAGTRAALLRDLLGKSMAPESDESVGNFIRRKFSVALLDRLVGPFVSGIYAGDPEKLSLRAAFPILYEAEAAAGSVLRGVSPVMKRRRAKMGSAPSEKSTLQSFVLGNETLIHALADDLGERLACNAQVTSISALPPSPEPQAPRFRVTARTPDGTETLETERLIMATPSDVAAKLLAPLNPEFESQLAPIEYAPVCVVSLGYRKADVGNPLNGFGFLVPRSAGLKTLGTVWNSSLFPGRAPEGYVLMTSFVGGATNPRAAEQTAEQLVEAVHRELTPILSIRNQPLFSNVTIWPRAIPQYNLGHTARIAANETLRQQFKGLYFAGNYLNGPAMGTSVQDALQIADEVRVSFAN